VSDLKYKTVEELKGEIAYLEKKISEHKQKAHNLDQRLIWARKYLFQKTPQELTMSQIEQALGHAVIIKYD
jgi:predicted RNase H-like nuclease (RuvC/YqgF family)